ncbi:MAG: phage tail sheath C-terminal domain-containing protein [Microbacterium sp.]
MPVQLSYPGVYVEEVPSGVRTIVGVATSVTAFVGAAPRGPVDEPVTVTGFGEYQRVFGGLWEGSRLGFAVRDFFLNGGGNAVVVRVFRTRAAPARNAAELKQGSLEVVAANPGVWGNALRIRVDHDTRAPDPAKGETATTLFNLSVRDGATGQIEQHRNVAVGADHPSYVGRILERDSVLVRLTAVGAARPAAHTTDPPAGKSVWDEQTPATSTGVVLTGAGAGLAADALELQPADYVGGTTEADKEGMFALEKADLFNLLVIPPPAEGDLDATDVIPAAATYCESRRAMLLLDAPVAWSTVGAAKAGITAGVGTVTKNAAIYFPLLLQPNPLRDNTVEKFSPGGTVAGVIARTDAQRGVWKAPAGLDATLNGAPQLTVALTDADSGQLNPLGVNCLRAMPGVGRVVWGARTLQGADRLASEWKYIPVRRTALFIEESLFRGTQWVVFEPNDEPLWAQIRLNVGAFMNNLFRQGAFQGTTPKEAYFVKCDRDTTTQADIDLGIVNIHVGFAPLKPAEFVVIRLQQMSGLSAA